MSGLMPDITIEINGQTLLAKPDQLLIQVADQAGIYIPRFCYHKHLSIAANCRMCLVEVAQSPKPVPACATPVTPNMKVMTHSAKTRAAQRAVMEFLLINHPLDCPICDQGGECELQDLALGYGASRSNYYFAKRAVANDDLGPLIATEMTRCIQCTRCVRFCSEIAGMAELAVVDRGEEMKISTYIAHAMHSELSGNIIDLCPVGALTSRPYRFSARPWELQQFPAISPHDCLGTNIYLHLHRGQVKRVAARENPQLNETWITDRDRFSYLALSHHDRLTHPCVRINGQLQEVEWPVAITAATQALQQVIAQHGATAIGALASPSATLEEFYLLQLYLRGLGSPHIDHRLRESDTRDQAYLGLFPGLGQTIHDFVNCDAIFLIAAHLRHEQPLAASVLRRAAQCGTVVCVLNAVDYEVNFAVQAKGILPPHEFVHALLRLQDALATVSANSELIKQSHHSLSLEDPLKQLHTTLQDLRRRHKTINILIGTQGMHHPEAALIRLLAEHIAQQSGGQVGFLTEGANSAGGWLMGAVPHREPGGVPSRHIGLSAKTMLAEPRKAYVLLNVEPSYDCANATQGRMAMQTAECIIACSLYRDPLLEAHATVLLPMAAFCESYGSYINAAGHQQIVHPCAALVAHARPAWQILWDLCLAAGVLGVDQPVIDPMHEITKTVNTLVAKHLPTQATIVDHPDRQQLAHLLNLRTASATHTQTVPPILSRVGEIPLYAVDSIVRRSQALQEAQQLMVRNTMVAYIHPDTAKQLDIEQNTVLSIQQDTAAMPLKISFDPQLAQGALWIAGGVAATQTLGDLFGPVTLHMAADTPQVQATP